MDYYLLDLLPMKDLSFCVLDDSPDGTEEDSHTLSSGESYGPSYPADPKWRMNKDYRGLKVGSLIANTSDYLVVHRVVKDVLVATGVPMDVHSFVLLDHKKKVASRDHFIVNVLGTFDCLNLEKSEIDWSKDYPDIAIKVWTYVLDANKVKDAPDIFRVKEDPEAVVVSANVGKALKAMTPAPTNIYLTKLEQVPGRR